jgi:hypothetical protein
MRKGVSEVRLHTYGEIEKEKEIDSGWQRTLADGLD